jgi:hypothetical protein
MINILLEIYNYEISEDELNYMSMNQLRIFEEMSYNIDIDDLLRLHENGDLLSILEIIEMYKKSEERFTDLSAKKVIDFYKQLKDWNEEVSFEDICEIYDNFQDKLWDLIDNEKYDHLIEDYGLQEVSATYDDIYTECGGNKEDYTGYNSEDGEEYNIYHRVYNKLSAKKNESNSDESQDGSSEDKSYSSQLSSDEDDEDSSENEGSSNEDVIVHCMNNIIYDHPELIDSLLYNKVGKDRFLESTIFRKDVFYTTTDTDIDICNGIDLNYILNKLENRVAIKSKTHILSPYIEWMLNGANLVI